VRPSARRRPRAGDRRALTSARESIQRAAARTCAAIEHLPGEDLAALGGQMVDALRRHASRRSVRTPAEFPRAATGKVQGAQLSAAIASA
jgi:hypothetical protein